jgi:hypothetical protein
MYPRGGEPVEVLIGKTEALLMLHRLEEAELSLAAIRRRGGLENFYAVQRLQEMIVAQVQERRAL